MIAVIWAILQPYLIEIFKHRLDGSKHDQKWKRSTIGQFMALYDSVLELEAASRAAYDEFADIGLRDGAIAKTIVASRLERLRSASKDFVLCARHVNGILSIYNDELAIVLTGSKGIKMAAWHTSDWMLGSTRSNNRDENQRPSAVISFTKTLPTQSYAKSAGEQVYHQALTQVDLDREAEAMKLRLLQKLKNEHGDILDLRDQSALKAQLTSLAETIEEIVASRTQLAQFIKLAYPIEKMMEDASASRS